MEEKITKPLYRRTHKNQTSRIDALTEAQKIAFAPFSFQTVACLIDFNIFKALETSPKTKQQLVEECNVSQYCIDTLFDAALCIGLVKKNNDETYFLTPLAEAFLYDEMTKVNFNFMKDVCFLGASELFSSFKENRPAGLQKYYYDSETIYPMLTKLPEKMKKSWYNFDHYYSDDCFKEVLPYIFETKPPHVFDIGANTGKFEKACLEYNKECCVTMIDLPENIEAAKNSFDTDRCSFWSADILSDEKNLPKMNGAVFMSQFLDCFSKVQIQHILDKISKCSDENIRVFILEPFIDKQQFAGAAYALSHISLYFSCMANGKSKMYNETDMRELINSSDFRIEKIYQNIGKYDYTLLECVKK